MMRTKEGGPVMAGTYAIAAYPKEISLRDGSALTVRPLEPGEADGLLDFFLGVPEDERFFLKDDVTSPELIREWTQHLDFDRALPLVALYNGQIIAEGVLIRRRGKARSHVGEVRITVTPSWRGKGIGTAIIRELCDIANDAELDRVLLEVVEDCEANAREAAEAMGFVHAGTIAGGARDIDGHLHDIVLLAMPLGKYYEWSKY
jgi:L-amino acid N-acyltransferase YncA